MATQFHPAATDPEEIKLIAQLASNFGDRERYQKYIVWLDGRDQKKADHIHALERFQFEKNAEDIPDAPKGLEIWDNAVGGKLQRGIRDLKKFGLRKHQDWIFQWVRPIVGIETSKNPVKDLPVGTSKFGGLPDVPGDFKWPTCSEGPLGFAGQINFSEIRQSQASARFGLPQSGLLLVFAFSDAETGIQPGARQEMDGKSKDIEGLTQVLYVRDGAKLHRHQPKVKLNEVNDILPDYALQMVDSLDLPVAEDVTEDKKIIDAIDQIYKDDFLRSRINESRHWLMGYSVHGRTSNTSPGPDWLSLMTLDSGNPGWSWCDGEHLDIYIHQKSLKDHSFQKIYGYAA